MSPMSWYGGSQDVTLTSASGRHRSTMALMFASRLAWVTITPRGFPVEPEVYCRKASASEATASGTTNPAGSVVSASVASHGTVISSPSSARPARQPSSRSALVRKVDGLASRTMPTSVATDLPAYGG